MGKIKLEKISNKEISIPYKQPKNKSPFRLIEGRVDHYGEFDEPIIQDIRFTDNNLDLESADAETIFRYVIHAWEDGLYETSKPLVALIKALTQSLATEEKQERINKAILEADKFLLDYFGD